MRKITTYCRILLLSVTLIVVPMLSQAQSKAQIIRECDSLSNMISKETDVHRLMKLNQTLANRYLDIYRYEQSSQAAEKAVELAKLKEVNDLDVQLSCNLLLGHNYVYLENPKKAIESYLSARKVLEKIANPKEEGVLAPAFDEEMDGDIVTEIGLVYFNRKHYERATESFIESLQEYYNVENEEKILKVTGYLATSYYCNNDNKKALKYYEDLLEIYKNNNDWLNTKQVYQRLNDIYIQEKDYNKVRQYNTELYNECTKRNNIKESLNALSNLAYSYVCTKDYDKAITLYNQLLENDPKYFEDERLLAGTYTNLGLCYENLKSHDQATANLKKALDIRLKHSQHAEAANVANILAHIYKLNDDLHNADYYQQIAVQEAEMSENKKILQSVYQNYNDILRAKGEYEKALQYYQKYLDIRDRDKYTQDSVSRSMLEDLKDLTDTENKYQEGLLSEDVRDMEEIREVLEQQKKQQEYELIQKQNEIQRMQMEAQAQALALARMNTEKAQKEAEIAKMAKEQAEKDAEIQRRKNEQLKQDQELLKMQRDQERLDNTIQQQEAAAKRNYLIMAFGTVVILFFIAMFILVRSKNKRLKEQQAEIESKNADLLLKNEEITMQKENLEAANNEILTKNEELSKQKELIETANKSITDSIIYAKRIQNAVSPPPEFLKTYGFDYFLFFRPRDIVSGDYYWFHAVDDYIFIVAADCTGHGVPGAFMSMLGLSLFNKIVAERKIYQPNLILNALRDEVKAALHQDSINSSQKDGMDLSLVRYDVSTKMIHFAAANNNGYLVQHYSKDEEDIAKENLTKSDNILETETGFVRMRIMPADSMPIGVYIREKESFTMTSYQLRTGDSFYLSSDGYIDQFGGKWGRKFLSKNFKKLIMDITDKPMKTQEKLVISTHEEWIGEQWDQLDDIIVIGVQV